MARREVDMPVFNGVSRRRFLRRGGELTLSATAVALLAGCGVMASSQAMAEPSNESAP